MNTRFTVFALLLCAAVLTVGCLPIPLLPSGEVDDTENDINKLIAISASRNEVIKSLGEPHRQYGSVISYTVCKKTAGVAIVMCSPFGCSGGDFRGAECFELILEFDGDYRLAGYRWLPFEGTYKTPAGSIWETTYPNILREKANNGDIESQFNLYILEKDNPENINRLCHLAGMGHTKAQMEVARLYWRRYDIDDNRSKAYMWYKLAATIDYSEGLFRDETAQNSAMAEVEYKRQKILTPDELVIAEQLQSQSYWEPEHCIHDLTSSIPEGFTWRPCNEEPYNTQDPKLYDQLLTLCREADAGHTKAQFEMGRIYWRRNCVPDNRSKSYMWYMLAATSDLGDVQYKDEAFQKRAAIEAEYKREHILSGDELKRAMHLLSVWAPGQCGHDLIHKNTDN